MAIQTSMITLSGKLSDQIHYNHKGKHVTRSKAKRYRMSEESKKSGIEFGEASKAASLIRKGFAPLLEAASDEDVVNRFNVLLAEVVRTGPAELKGNRKVTDGDLALLEEREFNRRTDVSDLFFVVPEIKVDPFNYISITLPEFEIAQKIKAIPRYSHAILQFMCCGFDFINRNGKIAIADELILSPLQHTFKGGTLEFPMDDCEGIVFVTGMSVRFMDDAKIITCDRRYRAAKLLRSVLIRDGKIVQFQYPEATTLSPAPAKPVNTVSWKLNGIDL